MKSKFFLPFLVALGVFFASVGEVESASVSEQKASAWVTQTGYRLIEALANPDTTSKYTVLDKMFENDVDTEYLARFVLGKYWKELDESQQRIYLGLFKRYVLSVYKSYPLNFNLTGLDFRVVSSRIVGNYTDVACVVDLPENMRSEALDSLNLEFKLSQTGNVVKIVDLKIAGSSLLMTYRNRFYTMVKDADEDMAWFLEDFEMLTASNEASVL